MLRRRLLAALPALIVMLAAAVPTLAAPVADQGAEDAASGAPEAAQAAGDEDPGDDEDPGKNKDEDQDQKKDEDSDQNSDQDSDQGSDDTDPEPSDDEGPRTPENLGFDLRLVTAKLPAMMPGQTGWVSAVWSAGRDVCDVRVTAKAPGTTIDYPANTWDHTSFYTDDALAATNFDYLALRVTAPVRKKDVDVTFTVRYVRMKDTSVLEPHHDLVTYRFPCRGTAHKTKATAELPILDSPDVAVEALTDRAEVTAGTPAWVPLSFRGHGPNLERFRVTVDPPPGATVTYPDGGRYAGLATDASLPVGGEDHAAVYLDPGSLRPGTYDLPVSATYRGGSLDTTVQLTVRKAES